MNKKDTLKNYIKNAKGMKSAWNQGVIEYALELVDNLEEYQLNGWNHVNEQTLLNGASNWEEYSYGGCSLIYNEDIAERLLTPSELKKFYYEDCSLIKFNNYKNPNKKEDWMQMQARALFQAMMLIIVEFNYNLLGAK
tara:strand:- start:637 stop:1050 length:414 start_codon:yes stop_codon:yes gene_type:complete